MITEDRRAVLVKRLAEAEEALHLVSMGQSARVFVDQTGERIEYGPTSTLALNKYIYALKSELGLLENGGPACVFLGR